MLAIIIITIITIYMISYFVALKMMHKEEKIDILKFLGVITIYTIIITYIALKFSGMGLEYENQELKSSMQNMLLALFIGVNLLINLPMGAKVRIEARNKNKDIMKYVIGFIIINVIMFGAEINYMKKIQNRVLEMQKEIAENQEESADEVENMWK